MRSISLLLLSLFVSTACGSPELEWSGFPDENEESYENDQFIECNGDVLVDKSFDSLDDCERYRDRHGPWVCEGIELDISC